MIWTLIGIGLIVAGFIVTMFLDDEASIPIIGLGAIIFTICLTFIIFSHITVDYDIQQNQIKYESLYKKLEIIDSDYEDFSKNEVINDITEWNHKVNRNKYFAKSPWTNWFYSQKVVDELQYINID